MSETIKRPRVRGRVKHTANGKSTWLELTSEGLRIRGYHCQRVTIVSLQSLVDLRVAQLPLL